jgi:MoCo/4Fe-4S cofactor protein with predicted Tat translocation signal
MEKKYWKSLEERSDLPVVNPGRRDEDASKSLLEMIDEEVTQKPSSRRNFLKFAGFSFATAAIATSCKNPVNTAIPLLNKPEEVVPGMANYYASTYFDGQDYCSVLVKVRDGRPIKIEGNELSSFNKGGTIARVQGSVLSLYDDGGRIKFPMISGKEVTWNAIDQEINSKLSATVAAGKAIVILTPTVISPTTNQLLGEFKAKYPTAKVVIYDPVSSSAILQANMDCFGLQVIPDYHLEKADILVSFGADFLGTWVSPVEYTRRWAESRRLTEEKKTISQLFVFESCMSLTGANADRRYAIKPSQQAAVILNLYNEIALATGGKTYTAPSTPVDIKALAKKLTAAKGKSLVICGINDPALQVITNAINVMLGNYGTTIDLGSTLNLRQGMDQDMEMLVQDMNAGNVGAIFFYNSNPAYNYGETQKFTDGLKKVPVSVSFATASDETTKLCTYVCPDHHFLESWNDAEPKKGTFSLQQPAIRNIFNTRQVQDSLLKWTGSILDCHSAIQKYWETNLFGKQSVYLRFQDFWNHSLQDGVFELEAPSWSLPAFNAASLETAAVASAVAPKQGETEVAFYETIALGNGFHTNNPWMMEMPDPISKVCWDNFAAISPKDAKSLGVENGDILKLAEGLELPAFIQPGQAEGTIGIAYGYGRKDTGKVADGIGKNVFPFMKAEGGYRKNVLISGKPAVTGDTYKLATTQMHHSMEGRAIVRETTLNEWHKKPSAGNEMHEEVEKQPYTLYKEFEFAGHHWGMGIDLNTCSGCSACVIGCQSENNVAVVGKEQVGMTRIMHWIRIDRYYSDDPVNPSVYFQPIMCQQCDNAPCENVCPVSATNHSNEGLNQMAYNRCIGTKYCINNCPYKVRRFNWFRYATNDAFDYNLNSDLGRMVLNPDVTVRERGVVEKCSFCVQRIQEKKLQAKLEDRELMDGEIIPACAQACPSGAIVFGDLNDPESRISKIFRNERNYRLLEEVHTLPSVGYLTKVRNREEGEVS